jgi:hypothetical protein
MRCVLFSATLLLSLGCPALGDTPSIINQGFPALHGLIQTLQAFEPAKSDTYVGFLFSAQELGQVGDPGVGVVKRAPTITSCTKIWSNEEQALVFAVADPPLDATHCEVGVLFLVNHAEGQWKIASERKFEAIGKDNQVSCTLTSYQKIGNISAPKDASAVVVKVTEECHGGGEGDDIAHRTASMETRLSSPRCDNGTPTTCGAGSPRCPSPCRVCCLSSPARPRCAR